MIPTPAPALTRRDLLLGRLGRLLPTAWRPTAAPAFSRLDALTTPRPPEPGQRAFIRLDRCLAWTGSFCTTCVERCPEPGAITLQQGRPIIEADRCVGCGRCGEVCPAPEGAIGWRAGGPRG